LIDENTEFLEVVIQPLLPSLNAREEYIDQLLMIARSRLESELSALDGMKLAHVVIQTQKFDMTLKNRYGYTAFGVASVFIDNQEVCFILILGFFAMGKC
jgi:hypothetical protein